MAEKEVTEEAAEPAAEGAEEVPAPEPEEEEEKVWQGPGGRRQCLGREEGGRTGYSQGGQREGAGQVIRPAERRGRVSRVLAVPA